jgi:hypothetical protein
MRVYLRMHVCTVPGDVEGGGKGLQREDMGKAVGLFPRCRHKVLQQH